MKVDHGKLTVLSPLFLGGWQQHEKRPKPRKPGQKEDWTIVSAEARTPSLRGVLRFWLRALRGSGLEKSPLPIEGKLFGSVGLGSGAGREQANASAVKLSLLPTGNPRTEKWTGPPGPRESNPIGYLLYPLTMKVDRRFYPTASTFSLRMVWRRPHPDEALLRALRDALFAAVHLGGLGTRSRRGAGSLAFETDGPWKEFFTCPAKRAEDFSGWLVERLGELEVGRTASPAATPLYGVLGQTQAGVGVVNEVFTDDRAALRFLGTQMMAFRGLRSPDCKALYAFTTGGSPPQTVERAAFGLPLVFRFKNVGTTQVAPENPKHNRRASPLLFSLNRLASGKLVITVTWLKSAFLPHREGLTLRNRSRPNARVDVPDAGVIRSFLESLNVQPCWGTF